MELLRLPMELLRIALELPRSPKNYYGITLELIRITIGNYMELQWNSDEITLELL